MTRVTTTSGVGLVLVFDLRDRSNAGRRLCFIVPRKLSVKSEIKSLKFRFETFVEANV